MPADGPNIIVILSDQLPRDVLATYGLRNVRTAAGRPDREHVRARNAQQMAVSA